MKTDPRTAFRALAAAIGGAATLTLQYFFPGIPEPLVVAWMAVYMAAVGLGEVWYDNRSQGGAA